MFDLRIRMKSTNIITGEVIGFLYAIRMNPSGMIEDLYEIELSCPEIITLSKILRSHFVHVGCKQHVVEC